MPALIHARMRLGDVIQREGLIHERTHLTRFDPGPDMGVHGLGEGRGKAAFVFSE